MSALKVLVAVLALANVGYFLWVRDIRGAETADGAAATLRLASEGPGTARRSDSMDGAASNASSASPAATSGSTGVEAGGPGAAAATAEGASRHSADEAELITNVKRCITVGPFGDVSQAAHAASTLRSGGYDPRQRVAEGEVWAGVWVYLPLPPTRAGDEQLLTRLKAAGIEDALEMPGPNDASVISLGLFSETKRAQARVAQVQALGFNPALADRKRTGDVYWIDLDLKPTDSLVKPSDLAGEGHIVRLEVKGCPVAGASR